MEKVWRGFVCSHHEAILWPQFVVRDLWLGGQVGGCVVVRRDELGVLIFMELIGSGLQHTLLQFNTPLKLHIPKCTERHEEAEQAFLIKKTLEREEEVLINAATTTKVSKSGGVLPV